MRHSRLLSCLVLSLLLTGCNFFDDDNDNNNALTTGLHSMQSNGVERTYYLVMPEDTSNEGSPLAAEELKPLIIGFHGSFASHRSWIGETDRYGLVDEVGNGAIMVFPDALQLSEDNINWNFAYDLQFFEDLLAELDRIGLPYDKNRLFITGHSSGGGMTHEIGCRYGDIVRAIAISSGVLISGGSCVGSVAVIATHGETDAQASFSAGAASRDFWVLYNGHSLDSSMPGVIEPCVDYSAVAFPNENYPMQWCQHPGDHPWTPFNAAAFWAFFSGLPAVEETADHPPGGGNEVALGEADTTISFTLHYPENMTAVTSGAISLYDAEYTPGDLTSPDIFLNLTWDPNAQAPGGQVTPGSTVTYNLIPIQFVVFSGEFDVTENYQLFVSIYNEGGSKPIPTPGIDHGALVPITFTDTTTPVIVPGTLEVTPIAPFNR